MRIVITGTGAVSACGTGAGAIFDALVPENALAIGIREHQHGSSVGPEVQSGGRSSELGYPAPFDPAAILGPRGLRLLDRATRLALSGAKLALADSGLDGATTLARPPGIVLGTSFGSLSSIAGFIADRLASGPSGLNPSHFPNTVINSPASHAAIRFGLSTLSSTIAAGWASGAAAIGYAADLLKQGRADAILAGGVEELTEQSRALYFESGLLAPAGEWHPASGAGTVLGEGAGLLVLEPADAAAARGGRVLAYLTGHGLGFEPSGGPGAVRRAVREALVRHDPAFADEEPERWPFDAIVSGACGVRTVDEAESAAMAGFSGPILRPKAVLGEADGAGGALAAALAALICERGELPGGGPVRTVLVSAPSYTGHAAALILRRAGSPAGIGTVV